MSAPKSIAAPKETVTATMSRWAAGLQYKDLSQDAIYQAKRFLLDSDRLRPRRLPATRREDRSRGSG